MGTYLTCCGCCAVKAGSEPIKPFISAEAFTSDSEPPLSISGVKCLETMSGSQPTDVDENNNVDRELEDRMPQSKQLPIKHRLDEGEFVSAPTSTGSAEPAGHLKTGDGLSSESMSTIPFKHGRGGVGEVEATIPSTEISSERYTLDRDLLAEIKVNELKVQDKHSIDSRTKSYNAVKDRDFFSDSELPNSKHLDKYSPHSIDAYKSVPSLKLPLLFVDGRHVRRQTDTTRKLFQDLKKFKDSSGKLPKKDFVKYFREQGMSTRTCRQMYAKFSPKDATSVSFREFNENILNLTLRVGEEAKDKPTPTPRHARGKTIKRWNPRPR